MLGAKVPNNIGKWDFGMVRYFMLCNSAGFRVAAKEFKRKHKLSKTSQSKLERALDETVLGNRVEMLKDLLYLSQKLGLSLSTLKYAMIFNQERIPLKYEGELLLHSASDIDPLTIDGYYIRIGPHTRLSTVKKTFTAIKKDYSVSLRYGDPEAQGLSRRNKPIKKLKDRLTVFLSIENYLFGHYYRRQESYQDSETQKGERRRTPFVQKAFLRFLDENNLADDKLEAIGDQYYSLLRYYSVPSLNEFENLLIKPLQIGKI